MEDEGELTKRIERWVTNGIRYIDFFRNEHVIMPDGAKRYGSNGNENGFELQRHLGYLELRGCDYGEKYDEIWEGIVELTRILGDINLRDLVKKVVEPRDVIRLLGLRMANKK